MCCLTEKGRLVVLVESLLQKMNLDDAYVLFHKEECEKSRAIKLAGERGYPCTCGLDDIINNIKKLVVIDKK